MTAEVRTLAAVSRAHLQESAPLTPVQILARGGKTFRFASLFLPRARTEDAAVVYALCRLVDDTVDDAPSADQGRVALEQLRAEVMRLRPARPLVALFLTRADALGLDVNDALDLMDGVLSDTRRVRVADDAELVQYAYRVAGTVGAMMCAVLGIKNPSARPFAVDLGIAMQLTNICRDVLEDGRLGRVYLPASRLRAAGIDPEALVSEDGRAAVDRSALAGVVRALLDRAECYYASGHAGLRYIPWRSRLGILVAARVYRRIGVRLLRKHGGDALVGRTVTSTPEKVWTALGALLSFFSPRVLGVGAAPAHDAQLQTALAAMPRRSSN